MVPCSERFGSSFSPFWGPEPLPSNPPLPWGAHMEFSTTPNTQVNWRGSGFQSGNLQMEGKDVWNGLSRATRCTTQFHDRQTQTGESVEEKTRSEAAWKLRSESVWVVKQTPHTEREPVGTANIGTVASGTCRVAILSRQKQKKKKRRKTQIQEKIEMKFGFDSVQSVFLCLLKLLCLDLWLLFFTLLLPLLFFKLVSGAC